MPRPTPTLRRAIGAVLAGGLCVGAAGCRDDGGGDTGAFCGQVEERLDELRATPETPEDVEALIALWKDVGSDAPLSIEQDWLAHILLFETVWDPEILTDEDKAEEAYARIYATERSSVAVAEWIQKNCGFDWGPVETIVPQVTTTTLAPGVTTAPTTPSAPTTSAAGPTATTAPG
jgi:hypothetical protein